ncbi:MAG: SH3 domain-containing protein [Clostridiales bacterium]|jgi:hypothetical protein|nr:SH3 domain-containing protein [Clostridiales bacterium]
MHIRHTLAAARRRPTGPCAVVLPLVLVIVLLAGCGKGERQAALSPSPAAAVTPMVLPVTAPAYTPAPAPTPLSFPKTGYCNGEGVNVRAAPERTAEIVDIMGENAVLNLVSLQDGWYRIDLDGTTAYVAENLVTIGDPPRKDNMHWARVSSSTAKLYKGPQGKDVSEVTLKKGDVLKVLRKMGDYLHVVYNKNLQRYIKVSDVEYISKEEYLAQTP